MDDLHWGDFKLFDKIATGKLSKLHPWKEHNYGILMPWIELMIKTGLVAAEIYTESWGVPIPMQSHASTHATVKYILRCVRDIRLTEKGCAMLAAHQLENMKLECSE
jgi:hypothetical protein